MDKLASEVAQALAARMSYGKWKALQKPVEIEKPPIPDGWMACSWCGEKFKVKRNKLYCGANCQTEAWKARQKQRKEAEKLAEAQATKKVCLWCGNGIGACKYPARKKYCSEYCSYQANYQMIKERKQRNGK